MFVSNLGLLRLPHLNLDGLSISFEFPLQVGVPVSAAHQMDVYQENEELKDELSKLAAKVRTYSFSTEFISQSFILG